MIIRLRLRATLRPLGRRSHTHSFRCENRPLVCRIIFSPKYAAQTQRNGSRADFRFLFLSLKQIREPSRDLKSEAGTNSVIVVLTDRPPVGTAIVEEVHAVGGDA